MKNAAELVFTWIYLIIVFGGKHSTSQGNAFCFQVILIDREFAICLFQSYQRSPLEGANGVEAKATN